MGYACAVSTGREGIYSIEEAAVQLQAPTAPHAPSPALSPAALPSSARAFGPPSQPLRTPLWRACIPRPPSLSLAPAEALTSGCSHRGRRMAQVMMTRRRRLCLSCTRACMALHDLQPPHKPVPLLHMFSLPQCLGTTVPRNARIIMDPCRTGQRHHHWRRHRHGMRTSSAQVMEQARASCPAMLTRKP